MPCPLKTTGSRIYVPLYLLAVAVTLFWTYATCGFACSPNKKWPEKIFVKLVFFPKIFSWKTNHPPIPKPDSTPFWERVVSDLRPPRIQKLGRGAPKLASRNHRGKPRYFGKEKHLTKTNDPQLPESNNSKRDSWQEFTPADSKWPFWDGENMTFLRS